MTHNEQIGDDCLDEKDSRFHDTEHRGNVGEVHIRIGACLAPLVGKVEANGIDDFMLWQDRGVNKRPKRVAMYARNEPRL